MRTLVYEDPKTISIPFDSSVFLQTPPLRPRIQGSAGLLRGTAQAADLTDCAQVTFHVRPMATGGQTPVLGPALLGRLQAQIMYQNMSLRGQEIMQGGGTSFAWPTVDVSGKFLLAAGSLTFDLAPWGVLNLLQMELTNHVDETLTLFVLTQIYADPRVFILETEREGVGTP